MRIILFVFILLYSLQGVAQSQSESNYSFGLNVISYGEVSKLLNEVRSAESYKSSKLNGFIAKFNDNQMSYRLIASRYFNKDYNFYNDCRECEYIRGKYTSYEIKLGFEKNILYAKLQPFYGFDLGYKSITFNGQATDFKTNNTIGNYQTEIQKKGSLFYPFIGLKYSPINQITFSIESGYNIFWSFEKQIKRYNDVDKTITKQNQTQWEFLNQPIGFFTIQYNFGAN
ncbi:MAG: hypothetical protein EAZ51_06030 [Sphingobacteriales bacterium]|nr:MAG: hypothetical protein EAZ64_06925 [Sphingobacteriales bacterium]TAF80449.1 MAG: hypothetical protein EAZ51_06030 [Sphingobacteriales bacterium]